MRHIPEAGAVCGNSARTDLCGGQGVNLCSYRNKFFSEVSEYAAVICSAWAFYRPGPSSISASKPATTSNNSSSIRSWRKRW